MRTDWSHLEEHRVTPEKNRVMGTLPGARNGAFFIPIERVMLRVLATQPSDDVPWEHVSVAARDYKGERTPTWHEMCFAKRMFWEEEEAVFQIHPPRSEYVNMMQHVLHLWKPRDLELPRPPSIAVGIRGVTLQ